MNKPIQTALLVLLPVAALAAGVPEERLDQQVQAYLRLGRFQGAVLVSQGDRPLLNKGYGWAYAEWQIPATPDTKFRLGSLTKQFTAMAALLLEQEGRWKTGDTVGRHWPEAPEAWRPITLHQLLTHTAGLPNYTAQPDYPFTMHQPATAEQIVMRVAKLPLEFSPGTQMKYSNTGYTLLGYLMERITGESYASLMRRLIFEPLGMRDSGCELPGVLLPRRAAGYRLEEGELRLSGYIDMSVPHAAGALYSTTQDLLRWHAALQAKQLLSAENYDRYFRVEKNGYAYGWFVRRPGDLTVHSHAGGVNGFSSVLLRAPERKLLVVALANLESPHTVKLGEDLLQLALGEEVPLPVELRAVAVPESILRAYPGEYELAPGFAITVTLENGRLMTQATGQPKIPVFAATETRFFPTLVDAVIEFQLDEEGNVTGLVLEQNGRRMPGRRK